MSASSSAMSPKPPEAAVFWPDVGGLAADVSSRGGDEPAAVLDRLTELGWPAILGNADHFLLEGSPRNFEEILFPETVDDSPWHVEGYELLAGGHTHVQWTTRIGDAQYVNPGSVGLAVDRYADRRQMPHAEFAIVTDGAVEFRHCAY